MRSNTKAPQWLLGLTITGREEEDPFERDDKGEILVEDGEQVLKDGYELDDDGKPIKIDEDPDDEGDKELTPEQLKERADALEESLRKERRLRRQAERDARKAKKSKQTNEENKDADETRKALEAAEARTKRLAEGLLNDKIDQAILAEARKVGFIDETDALIDAVRKEIDADQDEEDPTDIDIDMDSVKDAVAELARKKKHLVGSKVPDSKSGGRFRKNGGNDDKPNQQALAEHYPSLR